MMLFLMLIFGGEFAHALLFTKDLHHYYIVCSSLRIYVLNRGRLWLPLLVLLLNLVLVAADFVCSRYFMVGILYADLTFPSTDIAWRDL